MNISEMDDRDLAKLTDIMKAVAHPVRLRILCFLRDKKKNVGQLQELLDKNQALVSQQLRILRMNGLVEHERWDGHVYYQISPEKRIFIQKLLGGLCGCREKNT